MFTHGCQCSNTSPRDSVGVPSSQFPVSRSQLATSSIQQHINYQNILISIWNGGEKSCWEQVVRWLAEAAPLVTNATANNDAVGGAFLRHFFKNKFMWPPPPSLASLWYLLEGFLNELAAAAPHFIYIFCAASVELIANKKRKILLCSGFLWAPKCLGRSLKFRSNEV